MAQYSNLFTKIPAPLRPESTDSVLALVRDKDLRGGYRVVETLQERDSIPLYNSFWEDHLPDANYRRNGMLVYVIYNNKTYRLKEGLTNNDWKEVNVDELSVKGWIFPPVHTIVSSLAVSPANNYRVILTTNNKIYTYVVDAWIEDPQTEELKEGLAVVVLDVKGIALYINAVWHISEAHARQHPIDSPEDHTPDPENKGKIVILNEAEGAPTLIDIKGDEAGLITVTKDYIVKEIKISVDVSKIDHDQLFNWKADRHREMNYSETLKAYIIND